MKIIVLLLITSILQVSASTYGQNVTMKQTNADLAKVIRELRKQTGFDFVYSDKMMEDARPVSLNLNNVPFEKALEACFKNQPLTYSITDKIVTIKEKKPSLFNRILDAIKATDIRAKVLDETGKPLPGAVVKVKGTSISLITNNDGEFVIKDINPKTVLQISYIGYRTKEHTILGTESFISISMELLDNKLDEVNIVSTGYQKLPKERATGSFEQINNDLFNRNPGSNVIARLDGITTSTLFAGINVPLPFDPRSNTIARPHKLSVLNNMSIRGISTLEPGIANFNPLVVLDNFPYEGDVNNINPNDVESVTLLKDAAAASIWGIRASNGVIVITTKKAKYEQPLRLSLNNNITFGEKPDLFYQRSMSSSDYIDVEKNLFEKGFYDSRLADDIFYSLSPIVVLLAKQRELPANDLQGRSAIDKQIDQYRKYDVRKDISKYLYRRSINQQYSLNLTGGSKQFSYLLSGGYDRNRDAEVEVGYQRINLRNNLTFRPISNLEFQTDIFFTKNKYSSSADLQMGTRVLDHLPGQPYTQLVDDMGNHAEVINPRGFLLTLKDTYRKTAGNGRLPDWTYRPLDDIGASSQTSESQNILMNIGASYKLNPEFGVSVNYQYSKNTDEGKGLISANSYAMRDYINTYASYSTTNLNQAPVFNIPNGDRYLNNIVFQMTNSLRGQMNFNKIWKNLHDMNAIVGIERREVKQYETPYIDLYGYNANPLSYKPFPYNIRIPLLNGLDEEMQPSPQIGGLQTNINRNTSIFMNVAYTYNGKYTISVSARKDAANIYGVKVNRRGQPNWSTGASWNIIKEPFFKTDFLSSLKLRVTYGYLGNVNNTLSAYPIISYINLPNSITGLNYANVINPPNPDLRPERSGIANIGLDFSLKNDRLSGSLEYYDKRSKNLIAPTPLDLSTGFTSLSVNSANLKTTGMEVNLRSINVKTNNFQWASNLLFSYTRNIVTKYLLPKGEAAQDYVSKNGAIPQNIYLKGNDAFTLYSYKWAGLDPNTGDPLGYDSNGKPSKDYASLIGIKYTELENNGSVIPLYYGALRNTVTWKSISLSANILYKFGYKLNPPGISYSSLFSPDTYSQVDYEKRWQKPGDEKITNVPSADYTGNFQRDAFYLGSSARIIRGDHIRLQDIRVSYNFSEINLNHFVRNVQLYANINNLGIIWRANKVNIDPDSYLQPPAPRTITVGVNLGL